MIETKTCVHKLSSLDKIRRALGLIDLFHGGVLDFIGDLEGRHF